MEILQYACSSVRSRGLNRVYCIKVEPVICELSWDTDLNSTQTQPEEGILSRETSSPTNNIFIRKIFFLELLLRIN
ncbi:unnamed protein product [Allacma fusca]|uniref:Uncharacterized protein n=1 Tax=Allacma fusca TaxID=39272 RepID=A0A8J2L975_9HEXA|nr:unnamed protein product [Allacma fusca]